jgi:hypothetical protein
MASTRPADEVVDGTGRWRWEGSAVADDFDPTSCTSIGCRRLSE